MTLTTSKNINNSRRSRWFDKLIAIVVLINISLVFFDISYIPWRDLYCEYVPKITTVYDPIKGIYPHPETQNYLDKVNQLEGEVLESSLQSSSSERLLTELQILSERLIEDNPFDVANKSGNLAKIKNEMRLHTKEKSARKAFTIFWSQSYLSETGWQKEISFFKIQIKPLIESNYYRDIDEYDNFLDYFWLIDLPFVIIFAIEILARSIYISSKQKSLTWLEALLRRWYDLLLLIPFWRWLRIIPFITRFYQANILNLEPFRRQLNYDFAVNFAQEITEMVGIQVINQIQDAIRNGKLLESLLNPEANKPYIQVNDIDEVKAIATRIVNVSIYNVIPQIQTDIEALIQHTMENTLSEYPIYKEVKNIPGLNNLPKQFTKNLAHNLSQIGYQNIVKTIEDPTTIEFTGRIITNFRSNLEKELRKQHNLKELENLMIDMLEEIKINYVKGIALSGLEQILDEANTIQKNITH
jgi:hypothetical protein